MYLSSTAKQYIERWISLKNPDEFLKRIFFVLRDIHTVIKNQEAPINNHTIWFNKKRADIPPRFDERYLQLREMRQHKRAQSSQVSYRAKPQRFNENLPLKTFAPLINTKEFKQAFLRGQPYDITEMFDPQEPKTTSYADNLHSKTVNPMSKTFCPRRQESAFIGGVIPDPHTTTENGKRVSNFSKDLTRMTSKNFYYSGDLDQL